MFSRVQTPRIVIRNTSELMVDTAGIFSAVSGNDIETGIVLAVTYCANVRRLPLTSPEARAAVLGEVFAADLLTPVSVNAIANSIDLPYETARGLVGKLVAKGLCRRVPGGLIVDPLGLSRSPYVEAWTALVDRFIRLIHEVVSLGVDIRKAFILNDPEAGVPARGIVLRILFEFEVRQIENLRPVLGDLLRGIVWSAVLAECLPGVATNPELARRHAAEGPLPDTERQPASVRAVARRLNLPYETTRRHVLRLAEAGAAQRKGRGFIVPVGATTSPAVAACNDMLLIGFARMANDLGRVGFDVDIDGI